MNQGIKTVIYPVKDIVAAKALFSHVDEIKKSLQELLDAGAQVVQEVKDVGGGKLIASVKDADANIIGLIQLP